MHFSIIDKQWKNDFRTAFEDTSNQVRIICPFIKHGTIKWLLRGVRPSKILVLTRFNLRDFYSGVSDIDALKYLLRKQAQVRGIKGLHSKVYIFDKSRVIIGSANLTRAALTRNKEFGINSEFTDFIHASENYFQTLWDQAGSNVTLTQLEEWERSVSEAHQKREPTNYKEQNLPDFGSDVKDPKGSIAVSSESSEQHFIKFFGSSRKRKERTITVLALIKETGAHWAGAYPRGKRPRKVEDNDTIYMARFVKSPADIIIFGKATASKHQPERDDASPDEIAERPWKEKYPHYVRVRNCEFIDATLADGISLNEMKQILGRNSFITTANDPAKKMSHAYSQQPAVALTVDSASWLEDKLERAFAMHGRLDDYSLRNIP